MSKLFFKLFDNIFKKKKKKKNQKTEEEGNFNKKYVSGTIILHNNTEVFLFLFFKKYVKYIRIVMQVTYLF